MLASLRLDRGFSQEELAARSGMSVRAIGDLERGQVSRPRPASVSLLAGALALNHDEQAAFRDAALVMAREAGYRQSRPLKERAAPCQLPPDIADFTGRESAMETIQVKGTARGHAMTAAPIAAIVGKAGIGKTTLAVHAAHLLRTGFPDGQLYVNLRGAEAQALDPADVLGRFLRGLSVDGQSVPDDLESRVGLYRSLMADRRAIVVLDNAADEVQVRPLLPAGGGISCWSPAAPGWPAWP
jgi:transcriptional regulator with XRE-family HTH domain